MTSTESLNKAFQIIGELLNENCFDFWEAADLSFEDRKDYLRQMIFNYFGDGEVQLGDGLIKRFDTGNESEEGASNETIESINKFFENEQLVADIVLLMDEDMYNEYNNEILMNK